MTRFDIINLAKDPMQWQVHAAGCGAVHRQPLADLPWEMIADSPEQARDDYLAGCEGWDASHFRIMPCTQPVQQDAAQQWKLLPAETRAVYLKAAVETAVELANRIGDPGLSAADYLTPLRNPAKYGTVSATRLYLRRWYRLEQPDAACDALAAVAIRVAAGENV